MLQHAKLAVIFMALVAAPAAFADNDSDYVNFRSDKAMPHFNPYEYDIVHMTVAERALYHLQREKQRAQNKAVAAMYGRARMVNE